MENEALIPRVAVVKEIIQETGDVKTFRVVGEDGKKLFEHIPGQCAMLSAPGIGEAMISITSSPTIKEYQEFSIKKVGILTSYLHSIEPGQEILVRGPYGNGFPVDTTFKGKDLLFIAGGIGVAPLHSVINYCRAHRSDYGHLTVVYGSRSKEDLVDLKEMQEEWMKEDNMDVYLTIDREEEGWDGHVGFVPNYVTELNLPNTQTAVLCGPPIMIHFTLDGLKKLGFQDNQVYTTLEMRMKCGIGKCGRCNVGDKFVCKDGPVFSFEELATMTGEY
ncbi:MAG: FAD/NAD(P)-binding protein [Catonella sp.]|jgi:NAD(P)H-flavin reductase|nr:FAD/NAD(P)-binding protein [Catonella sp.]MDY6356766.1 FAD/NAD(P)-binding protein [Catonella sp.]